MFEPNPSTTYALLVGIEKYNAGTAWDLNGPANDIYRFAEWLRHNKVPTENISILLSPLDKNKEIYKNIADLLGREPLAATSENFNKYLSEDLVSKKSSLFFFFWTGHGIISTAENTRRLYYADATSNYALNLDFTKLLNAMQTDYYKSTPRQIFFIDACANYLRGSINQPNYLPAASSTILPSQQQFALFAAEPGGLAINNNDEQTGLFSRELLTILNSLPEDGAWPPNMKTVTERIEEKFIDLRQQETTKQIPVFWWSDWVGNEKRIGQSDATLPRSDRIIKLTDPLFQNFFKALEQCEQIFRSNEIFLGNIPSEIRRRITFREGRNSDNAWSIAVAFRSYPDHLDDLLKAVKAVEGQESEEYKVLERVAVNLRTKQLERSWT